MSDRLSILEQEDLILKELAAFKGFLGWETQYCTADVARMLRLLHDQLYAEFLNVNWLEENTGYFTSETKEQFKRCVKFRVHEYIENRRTMAAMWLIWNNDLSLSTVSYCLGYTNYRTFARAFERQVGCPPHTYRERWSKAQTAARSRTSGGE